MPGPAEIHQRTRLRRRVMLRFPMGRFDSTSARRYTDVRNPAGFEPLCSVGARDEAGQM